MTIKHKLPPFQNVGANLTAVLPNMPTGMTYHAIHFKLGGTAFTKAQMSNIRVRLQGKPIADVEGAHLDSQNQYMKRTASATYLSLYFGAENANTYLGKSLGAIDTSAGITNMGLEVDIGAATAPTLEAWAEFLPPKDPNDPNRDVIRAMLKSTHYIGGAGEYDLPIPLGSVRGAAIKRLFEFHTNATKLQVLKDGLYLLQEGESGLLDYLQGSLRRTAQAGLIVFDPTDSDYMSDRVPTVRPGNPPQPASFQFKTTVSAADTVTAYTELLTTLDKV